MATPTLDKILPGNLVMHDHSASDLGAVLDSRYVQTVGDSMTGALVITPTADSTAILQINQADTTNVLTVDTTNGRVGIGTTLPLAALDIAGSASMSGTLAFRGTTDPKIDILNGENFGIRTSPGGIAGLAEKFTILNNGNVGIGTTGPLSKLGVLGNLSIGATYGSLVAPTSGMIIEGNVGVGTTAPGAKLHVSDSGNMIPIFETTSTSGVVNFRLKAPGRTYQVSTGGSAAGTIVNNKLYFYDEGASAIRLLMDTSGNFGLGGTITDAAFTGASMVINSGNVGIGVTDPDTKLEVFNAGNQLKLSFDATDNAVFAVDTNGDLTITPSGDEIIIPDAKNITVNTTTGTEIATATGQKLGFWGTTPVVQQVFATGASHTVDELITVLQTLGLVKQS